MSDPQPSITIRAAAASDLEAVVTLDRLDTVVAKEGYWRDIVERCITARRADRVFLVGEAGGDVVGFVVGEVRAWEFASPSCGWAFAANVSPGLREHKIGSRLLVEICVPFQGDRCRRGAHHDIAPRYPSDLRPADAEEGAARPIAAALCEIREEIDELATATLNSITLNSVLRHAAKTARSDRAEPAIDRRTAVPIGQANLSTRGRF